MKLTPVMNHQHISFKAGIRKPALDLSELKKTDSQLEKMCVAIVERFGNGATPDDISLLKELGPVEFFASILQSNRMKPFKETLSLSPQIPISKNARHLSLQESVQLASEWEEFLKGEVNAQKKRRVLSVQDKALIKKQIEALPQVQGVVVTAKDVDAKISAAQSMHEIVDQYVQNPSSIIKLVDIFDETTHSDKAFHFVVLNSLEVNGISQTMKKVQNSILNYMRAILQVLTKDCITRKNKAVADTHNTDYISAITAIELGITQAILKTPFFYPQSTDPQKLSLTRSLQNTIKVRLEEANLNLVRIASLVGINKESPVIKSYYDHFVATLVERYIFNKKMNVDLNKNFEEELAKHKRNPKVVIKKTWNK